MVACIYSVASGELARVAEQAGIPVAETFAGKGAVDLSAWWQLGGIGLEGNPATNQLAARADVVISVGSRLTDFATASQSLFAAPDVRFASINLDPRDADRLGATSVLGDAKLSLQALADELSQRDVTGVRAWRERSRRRKTPGSRYVRRRSMPTVPPTRTRCERRPPTSSPTPTPCSPRAS